jgi:hypothetical protein
VAKKKYRATVGGREYKVVLDSPVDQKKRFFIGGTRIRIDRVDEERKEIRGHVDPANPVKIKGRRK